MPAVRVTNLGGMMHGLETNHVYEISWRARDIGYGIEEGADEYVYRGLFDTWGKHEFQPLDGSATLYLFPDEILTVDGRDVAARA